MKPLSLSADVATILVLVLLGALYGRRLWVRGVRLESRDAPRKALLLSVSGLVFIFGNTLYQVIETRPAVAWYVPVFIEYYCISHLWILNVAIMAFAFGSVVTLGMVQRHRMRWVLVCVAVFTVVAGESLFRYAPLSGDVELHDPRIDEDGVVRQTCGESCAAASCANVARYYGLEKTEREMVDLLGTRKNGTSPAQVIYGMRSLGFKCKKRNASSPEEVRPPAVFLVDRAGGAADSHAVVYMGPADEGSEIWDPAAGKVVLKPVSLEKIWHGRAIEIGQ